MLHLNQEAFLRGRLDYQNDRSENPYVDEADRDEWFAGYEQAYREKMIEALGFIKLRWGRT